MFQKLSIALGLCTLTSLSPAAAASLQVTPVLLDVQATGDAATSITLRNPSSETMTAQVRVYRWSQANGRDVLDETNDVMASPPIVNLKPNSDYTVRVVRLTRKPVVGEESYRLLADEVPNGRALKANAVTLVVRQSVPVFFRAPNAAPADLSWSATKSSAGTQVKVTNNGEQRVRIARLKLSSGPVSINYGDGLVGYVLARSSMSWTSRSAISLGANAKVTAATDGKPVEASIAVR